MRGGDNGVVAIGTAETGAEYPAQLAALMLAALGLRLQIQFRPQLFDYIFLSALLAILARESRGRRARLWLAIPMMAAWANLHGGFLIGLVVLGLYAAVAGVQDLLAGRGRRRAIYLCALTSAALLATLINPFGIREWYVAIGKFSEPVLTLNRNVEFQSPFYLLVTSDSRLGLFYAWLFPVAIMTAAVISFALTPRRDDFALMAVAVMMICAWLYAVRNMAFAVIACTAPLAGHLELVIAAARSSGAERPRHDAPARASASAQLLALASVVFLAVSCKIFSPRLPIYMDYPAGAVAFMQRNHLSGNILSTYAWGGYIIWHDVPPSKVFFDSFYAIRKAWSTTIAFITVGSNDTRLLDRYPHDYVLVPASSYLDLLMAKRSDWAPIYRDSVCVLFARAGSAAAARGAVRRLLHPAIFRKHESARYRAFTFVSAPVILKAVKALVIGGGIIGSSIAWRLASDGVQVSVFERGRLGLEASWAAAGLIGPQAEAHEPGAFFNLALAGKRSFDSIVERLTAESGVDPEYDHHGVSTPPSTTPLAPNCRRARDGSGRPAAESRS